MDERADHTSHMNAEKMLDQVIEKYVEKANSLRALKRVISWRRLEQDDEDRLWELFREMAVNV